MLLSLRATWVHMRQMSYQGLDALRHSPFTPPVTIIIPAWNEQDVIVNSVRSALQADYPDSRSWSSTTDQPRDLATPD